MCLCPSMTMIKGGNNMNSPNCISKQTTAVAIGQLICVTAMIGVFALVGKFQMTVLYGGLAGGAVAFLNYFVMVLFANKAADKAQAQDVVGGQKLIHLSYTGRLIVLFAVLVLLAKSGWFHPLALVLPLAFTRPILTVRELMGKRGGAACEHER